MNSTPVLNLTNSSNPSSKVQMAPKPLFPNSRSRPTATTAASKSQAKPNTPSSSPLKTSPTPSSSRAPFPPAP